MEEIGKMFSWPLVVLIFSITFLFLFRGQIGTFISRIRSAGKSGVQLEQTPDRQGETQRKEVVQALMDLGNSPLRDGLEKQIFGELKNKQLETEVDTVKILVRHLAATQIALDFEQIYNLIFGSQIFLLKKLNEVAGQGRYVSTKMSPQFNHAACLALPMLRSSDAGFRTTVEIGFQSLISPDQRSGCLSLAFL